MPSRWNLRGRDTGLEGEKLIGHDAGQVVGIGGDALFEVKQAVGIAVDFIAWCGGETDKEEIEAIKDGAVLVVNRAVRFIDDIQVEMTKAEAALAVLGFVDGSHHGGVRGDEE
jgi:hypothetical protein